MLNLSMKDFLFFYKKTFDKFKKQNSHNICELKNESFMLTKSV